jgi:hypothetical protein
MISFVVITSTPGLVVTFLTNRGVIEQQTDSLTGQTYYVGVRPGMEWVRVPNPIQTAPASGVFGEPGYVPPTMDTRACFLVKFAHESQAFEDDNLTNSPTTDDYGNIYDYTRFGRWVKGNSTTVAAPANYLINGVHAGNAYKINGQQVWLIRDNPERFGVWQ